MPFNDNLFFKTNNSIFQYKAFNLDVIPNIKQELWERNAIKAIENFVQRKCKV